MTPEFSEFSYGFALLNDIVGWSPLAIAPILPSLIEEANVGYDVKLDWPGVPLYLQFKRADFMLRRTKKLRRKTKLNSPYYRFKVMDQSRSRQHQLLCELDRGNNTVFYAAPRFHQLAAINAAWSAKRVGRKSIFVQPSEIGELDEQAHYVAFDELTTYVLSEPREISHATDHDVLNKLQKRLKKQTRSIRDNLPNLIDEALKAERRADLKEQHREDQREAAKLARAKDRGLREPLGYSVGRTSIGIVPVEEVVEPSPIPTRQVGQLSGPQSELRRLAEIAAHHFDTQLCVVQPRQT
ncbi:hypothetical protein [Hyphomicrobium sp.]|uniref:hypothetical protein n=1 Tax=Hyphomicrobium sp. TaxID=82 RepID=UPI000FBD86F4|nr:hypothetical protein [Hyphomicrobium sp.]RUO98963.1 MAG: hypothetical protein EKK30_08910 [Hyphomicrobium sp.]